MTAAPDTATGPTLRLILGDQLDPLHPWLAQRRADVVYVLMEMRQETDYVLHHAQKVLAIFAAMRTFGRHLRGAGHRVRYVTIDDPSNRQRLTANLDALIAHYRAVAVEYQWPDEWRLDAQLRAWAAQAPVPVRAADSAHFYTPRDGVARALAGHRQWVMEHFYRQQRRRHRVLMDGDQPAGGRWNFDADNRQPWRGDPPPPPDTRPSHDHRALWHSLVAAGVRTVGDPQADALRWPVDRAEALTQLDAFITHALPHFGRFQDALSSRHTRLFHSLLSFALNVKMLRPQEVVARAEAAWRDGHAPLPAVEGFVRQILGWREYVRGVYWAHMPDYTRRNALGHARALPAWYWSGDTGMACLRVALRQTLDGAYAHHIQRLMVTGNFALLAGCAPQEVHRWYLGVYIDAFEWVEAPNTLGMSQWADGGLMATKPYVSSAAYLHRMGDHCNGCAYDPKQRVGERACPFNALYWDFLARHRERLAAQPRMAVIVRQLDRMAPADLQALRAQAATTLERIDRL
ncbi:deoxyribodipyrimidine photolyase [Tepidimonas fonticaldi]|uniref:Deoxyribodipyrimidine photolyase n=1 Tax=Tepidimonas fonticaldi TaxID=1101373 RepID=A0A1A6DSE6_9BURK|nr:cryptochrome/photolyase family protein [Tepidimonas fonticaldi]OBS29842.1 deoxyribodipyrimidine photolyase [Tepidimonas fonticaldi]